MKLRSIAPLILGLAILQVPTAAAQSSAKSVTLGILQTTVSPGTTGAPAALVEALRELGYQEGRNLKIEFRYGDGTSESLSKLATELVNLNPDVVVAGATPAVVAMKKATATIPIVMVGVGNPVEVGLVQSLAHPGGNVTGRSNAAGDLAGKRLQLVAETLPRICCVALLVNPTGAANLAGLPAVTTAAKSLGIELKQVEAANPEELDQVLAAPLDVRFGRAIDTTGDVLFWARRAQIAEAALRRGIALFGPFRETAEAGALMAYGVDNDDEFRAVAIYVDKVLKGVKPADLPVEQPTRFRLVVNLKTARALGLTIPPAILQRADEVIE